VSYFMSNEGLAELQTRLREFIIPFTARELGQAGSEFHVEEGSDEYRVSISLGFPINRSSSELVEAIRAHTESLKLDKAFNIKVDWAVTPHTVQHGLKPLEGVSNIVAVASGKGGVGKSTITVNLALVLAQEGARVGILDADIYGPSQPRMLGLLGKKPETRDGKTLEPLVAHGVKAMSIGFLVDERQPMAWRGPMVTSALNQLLSETHWGELDYLLVDMPPGTGDIQLTLSQRVPVSGAIVVTTPQEISLADARKGLEMFQKVNVPILGIVENMSAHICSSCGHENQIFGDAGGKRLSEQYEVPLLGSVPLDSEIRENTDEGNPSVVSEPDSPAAASYRDIALRASGQLAASGKDYSGLFPTISVEEDE
jgi:ATP-binding protein involved in chromosome partitioning